VPEDPRCCSGPGASGPRGVSAVDPCVGPTPIRIDAFRAALIASGLYPIAPPPIAAGF
jgi:hypothetical protein